MAAPIAQRLHKTALKICERTQTITYPGPNSFRNDLELGWAESDRVESQKRRRRADVRGWTLV